MTTPVQTLGPADPKAPLVAKFYTIVTSLLGLVTLASTFNLITTDQATAISNAGTSILGAAGTIVAAIAAFRTHKQVNNGTFDPAPTPVMVPTISTTDQIVNAIPAVLQDAAATIAAKQSDVEKIKQAAADAFGTIPVVGPLAEQVIASVTR